MSEIIKGQITLRQSIIALGVILGIHGQFCFLGANTVSCTIITTITTTIVLQPFVRDYLGELVPLPEG